MFSVTTKIIFTTKEMITATLNVVSFTTKVLLSIAEVTTAILKFISTIISVLSLWKSDHVLLENDLNRYKGDLGH